MYKVGDKVRIREWDDMAKEFGVCGSRINTTIWFIKEMQNYCGRDFVIVNKNQSPSEIAQYKLDGVIFYTFTEEMFEKPATITEHIVRGNKIIVKLSNGRVGVAKCNPEDQFDILYGTFLATLRAYKGKDANIEKRVTYCVSEDKQ